MHSTNRLEFWQHCFKTRHSSLCCSVLSICFWMLSPYCFGTLFLLIQPISQVNLRGKLCAYKYLIAVIIIWLILICLDFVGLLLALLDSRCKWSVHYCGLEWMDLFIPAVLLAYRSTWVEPFMCLLEFVQADPCSRVMLVEANISLCNSWFIQHAHRISPGLIWLLLRAWRSRRLWVVREGWYMLRLHIEVRGFLWAETPQDISILCVCGEGL